MIRSEILEHFLLEFGLAIPNNDLGRPTTIAQLGLAASAKCGDCDGELLDALYNLRPEHAELWKYATAGSISFERVRSNRDWKNFFTVGSFDIRVMPRGRIRFEKLEQSKPMPQPDDRQFARLAVDEARKSVSENDNRAHPKVGAVVVKDGKVLSTAHRGEQPGNHAEYVALEKKLSDEAVAGATVYTTLEPCTTRTHPKVPCTERLIERRVARVVMGMLDPDVRITGRGQRKLRTAGIATDFFPPDLMAEVEDLNRDFTRSCEQNVRAEVGPANMELWKEVAGLRTEFAAFRQNVEARDKERAEFEHFKVNFSLNQGVPGNYVGLLKNDSKYKVVVETIQIFRGDVDHESQLTEAVKPRPTDDWKVEPGTSKTLYWGPQYEPIGMLKSLVQSSDPNFTSGKVITIALMLTLNIEGKRLPKKYTQQVLMQGTQITPWGP